MKNVSLLQNKELKEILKKNKGFAYFAKHKAYGEGVSI